MIEAPSGNGAALMRREKEALHIDIESRVIVLPRLSCEGSKFRNARICENNSSLPFSRLNLCEEAVQIRQVRHVSCYAA